jgi:hypothetical protein
VVVEAVARANFTGAETEGRGRRDAEDQRCDEDRDEEPSHHDCLFGSGPAGKR